MRDAFMTLAAGAGVIAFGALFVAACYGIAEVATIALRHVL